MKMMPTPSFFFFRTNSKKNNSNSGLPPYSKRAIIAVSVAIPMAFGLNIPLNTFGSFMPVWGIIMINAIVIPSYMTFIIPKASKVFASWLNSTTIRGVN
jgi:antibiotic biosynthesis monooxygenase (ABM) superfamily enzyme